MQGSDDIYDEMTYNPEYLSDASCSTPRKIGTAHRMENMDTDYMNGTDIGDKCEFLSPRRQRDLGLSPIVQLIMLENMTPSPLGISSDNDEASLSEHNIQHRLSRKRLNFKAKNRQLVMDTSSGSPDYGCMFSENDFPAKLTSGSANTSRISPLASPGETSVKTSIRLSDSFQGYIQENEYVNGTDGDISALSDEPSGHGMTLAAKGYMSGTDCEESDVSFVEESTATSDPSHGALVLPIIAKTSKSCYFLDSSGLCPSGEPSEFRELSASFSVKISASSPRLLCEIYVNLF